MELTTLKYFVTLAHELHFSKAAEKLHITQPPLSRRIKSLEEELEIELFIRSSRRVALSAAGKIFYHEAKSMLQLLGSALKTMENFKSKGDGILRIRFNETSINSFLPSAISKFRDRYPNVKLELLEMESAEQFDALQHNLCDISILRPYGFDYSKFCSRLLLKEDYLLALNSNHPLAAKSTVSLPQASKLDFILFPRAIHKQLYDDIKKCFINLKIVQHAVSKQTTLALVSAGIGVALVPESNCTPYPGIAYKKITGTLPAVEIYALNHSNNTLANRFIDLC